MNIMNFIYFELRDEKINAEMIITVYSTLLQKRAESERCRNYTGMQGVEGTKTLYYGLTHHARVP